MTRVSISQNPQNRFYGIPETVETIEITHVLLALKELADIATIVNKNPTQYCPAAQVMAELIKRIVVATFPN